MRTSLVSRLWPLVASVSLVACSSASIESTKDAAAAHKLQRVFVLISHGNEDADLSTTLDEKLKAQFQASGSPVVVGTALVSPLALDESTYIAEARKFEADAVMTIRLTSALRGAYGAGYAELRYDVSLFDLDMKKRWWRAAVQNDGGTALIGVRMEKMSRNIVTRLREDGFL